VDKAHHAGQAPAARLLLVRLPLVLLGGVLLVLLFSRPADAAERRRWGLLDPRGRDPGGGHRACRLAGQGRRRDRPVHGRPDRQRGSPDRRTNAAPGGPLGVGGAAPAAAEADVALGLSGLGDLAPAAEAPALPALPALPDTPALPGASSSDGLLGDIPGIGVGVDDLVPPTVCPGCGQDTSTGGTTAPTPGAPGTGQTGASAVVPGPTGTTTTTRLAPLRPALQAGPGGTLPFTGDALDLLALVAMALLAAGGLFLRAVQPAPAGAKGGDRQSC
jgi:hypothetical protein